MPDSTTPPDETTAARKKQDTTDSQPAPTSCTPETAPTDAATEPYPGQEFFHGGRHSDIVTAMAARLEAEGCGDGRYLGPDWTNAHRDAFAAWQRKLRPKGAGDVAGIPDETAWDRLQVPRVTPLPQES
jgi:hypothetical protein